ncbi:MAG: hypothetical protein CMJ18_20440 [Phycisphaeraceae bacterium]|nr:hypothetical protein [Phycisphaeraceae bacterium]
MSSPGSSLSDVLRDLAENRSDAPREADRSIVKPPADAPTSRQTKPAGSMRKTLPIPAPRT